MKLFKVCTLCRIPFMTVMIAYLCVAVIASARLNRLLVHDVITALLRARLDEATNPAGRFVSAMLSCVWCTGMYTAAATATYAHWAAGIPWTALPLTILAIAWLAPTAAHWAEG